jgi:hypothetical protein
VATPEWDVYLVNEVREWIQSLDTATHARVMQAMDALAEAAPRSWLTARRHHHPPPTRRWRLSILLVASDKAGQWNA